jgi:hypothetical protein
MTAFQYRVTVWRAGRSRPVRDRIEVNFDPKDTSALRAVFEAQVKEAAGSLNLDLMRYRMLVRKPNNVVVVRRVTVDSAGRTVVKR